ncbi:MAG: NifB/NifX family molybdenum-iron cluster-binding protein [bacterium]
MRVAIPIWNKRVSPVFDAASQLLVVQVDNRQETTRHLVELPDSPLSERVSRVRANRVETLLCGAISRPLHRMLTAVGIEVIPFLAGDVESLLAAFGEDRLSDPQFQMPGCRNQRQRRRRRRRCKDRGSSERKRS